MMETAESKWSQLPKDLLLTVSEIFSTTSPLHILILRSVCSSWRSSVPPTPFLKNSSLPLNLPFPIAPNPALHPQRQGHFSLTKSTIYILQNPNLSNTSTSIPPDSKPWLIRIEETREGKLRLLTPLSRIFSYLVGYPKSLNLQDTRVTEIGRAYHLDFVETSSKNIELKFGELKSILIKKAVVSEDPWIGDDYAVMAICGGKLGLIKIEEGKWSPFDDPWQWEDVVYHNQKFYAMDYNGRTVSIGLDLKANEVAGPFYGGGGESKNLVKSQHGLFLVDKYMGLDFKYEGMNIYKLNEEQKRWDYVDVDKLNEEEMSWHYVDTLGDQVFLVGYGCSYVVGARDFPGLRGDSFPLV
ncbi:hypothetical protein LguiA_016899 [Lonicera macranthoides]